MSRSEPTGPPSDAPGGAPVDAPGGAPGDGQGEVPAAPVIRILHGAPTREELGVIVALLSAMGGGRPAAAPAPTSRWAAPGVRLGQVAPGRDGWRFSGMPR